MPLHESSRLLRDRWPLQFDLEGIPRDTAERERMLQEHLLLESLSGETLPETPTTEETMTSPNLVANRFASDNEPAMHITDINNPPHINYNPHDPKNEFPKMLYPANYPNAKAVVVKSKEEEAKQLKKGFSLRPPVKEEQSA